MAGFSHRDQNNMVLLEASVTLDSIFPPSMNFNATPWVNGTFDRKSQLWVKLNISDFYPLYQNLMNPTTYAKVNINIKKGNSSVTGSVGIDANGMFYVNNGTACFAIDMGGQENIQALAMYVYEWWQHAGVYKDIFENIRNSICKSVATMLKDALKLDKNPSMFEKSSGTSDASSQSNSNSKFKASPYNNQAVHTPSQMPQAPQMPQPQMPQAPQMQQPQMPQAPQMPQPQMPQAPQMGGMPIPQMGGIPMGIPIPQTPMGAGNNVDAQMSGLINSSFGQMPRKPV